ncbi:hypothetical protein GCM10009624_30170 [Gordonia sinesedis]
MSDFIKKIKEDAKAVSAAIDQELTVLEGVPGYDPLKDEDKDSADGESEAAETAEADTADTAEESDAAR